LKEDWNNKLFKRIIGKYDNKDTAPRTIKHSTRYSREKGIHSSIGEEELHSLHRDTAFITFQLLL